MTEGCEIEPEYVVVCESEAEGADRLELPTNASDSSLGLQTLTRAFPNAHGLKYKNPATGAYRALLTDPSGTIFYKPAGGWQNKLFVIIFSQPPAATSPDETPKVKEEADEADAGFVGSQPTNSANADTTTKSTTTNGASEHAAKTNLSSATTSSVAKKSHAKTDQNAKRRKLMRESDDDADPSSGSESNGVGDKRLRQSGGRAASSKQKRPNSSATETSEASLRTSELIILGLPFKISEEEIRAYFEPYGGLSHLEIKRKLSGGSKGFGFIRMRTFDGQMRVLKKPNHLIGNRKCQVRVPTGKNGEEREDPTAGTKVFVGRLQERTTISDLRKYFNEEVKKLDENASVIDVYIPKPFRAFAFVTFSNPVAAKKIIKKGNYSIDGSTLSLQSAQPKSSAQNSTPMGPVSPGTNSYARGGPSTLSYGEMFEQFYDPWFDAHGGFPNELFPSHSSSITPHFARLPTSNSGFGSSYGSGAGPSGGGGGGGSMTAGGAHHQGSQIIASGLDALNLNNMKPELLTALKALMNTKQHHSAAAGRADARSPMPMGGAAHGGNFGGGGAGSPPIYPQRLFGASGAGGMGGGSQSRGVGEMPPGFGYLPRRSGGGGGASSNGGGGGSSSGRTLDGWR